MALKLLSAVGAGVSSKWLDIRSVGSKMVPFIVYVTGNDHTVVINKSPDNGTTSIQLGTIAANGGQLVVDEPIDYVQVVTNASEGGAVSAFITTSR